MSSWRRAAGSHRDSLTFLPATPLTRSTQSTRSTWRGLAPPVPRRRRPSAGPGVSRPSSGATASGARNGIRPRSSCGFPIRSAPASAYRSRSGVALLVRAFPGVRRVTVRLAEPLSRRLMWPGRRGLDEGWGSTRVEVWGWRGQARESMVYGVIDRTADRGGTVLAVTAARASPVSHRVSPPATDRPRVRTASRRWSSRCRSSPSWPDGA